MKQILFFIFGLSSLFAAGQADTGRINNGGNVPSPLTARYYSMKSVRIDSSLSVKANTEFRDTVNFKGVVLGIPFGNQDGIISGGVVTWVSGLTFDVSPAVYRINGVTYTKSTTTQVTLSASDPTNPREDLIILTTTSTADDITGTPSTPAVAPTPDIDTQLPIALIRIAAGATTPTGISNVVVYNENTEWTGTGDFTGLNFNYATNPFSGSKSTFVSGGSGTKFIRYTNSTTADITNYQTFKFYIRLNNSMPSQTNMTLQFLNSGAGVSSQVIITAAMGLNKSTINAYQVISIPISAFTFSSSTFNAVQFRTTQSIGSFQLDDIILQSGIPVIGTTGVTSFAGRTGAVNPVKADYNAFYMDTTYLANDTTLRSRKGSVTWDIDLPNNGGGGSSTDTTNKFVNNVTSVNDSTIRIWKGTGAPTDLTIKGGVGGSGSPTDTTSLSNRINTKITNYWERKGVVLTATLTAETDNVYEPTVIREATPQILTQYDTVFKMWYTSGWSTRNTAYAESVDGVNWVKYASNPVVSSHARSHVIKNGSTYYMYASNSTAQQIDRYTSSNGVTWTLATSAVITVGTSGTWNDASVQNMFVWIESGTWYMLIECSPDLSTYSLGLYTSADGITWTANGGNPVLTGLSPGGPFVKKIGSTYWLWAHGGTVSLGLPTQISRYYSTNLTSWTNQGVVLSRRQDDEGPNFTSGQVADPFLMAVDSSVYMWYAGSRNGSLQSGKQQIKLAVIHAPFETIVQGVETDRGDIDNQNPEVVGTATSNPYIIETYNVERMRIDSAGLIGIGLATPTAVIDAVKDANSFQKFRMKNSNTSGSAGAQFDASNQTFSGSFGMTGTGYSTYGALAASNAHIYTSADFTLMTDGTNKIIKFAPGGNTERFRFTTAGLSYTGSNPTALLHFKAGTATASTAPIKFTSGTELTTPEAGVLETASLQLKYSSSTTAASRGYVDVTRYAATATSLTADGHHSTIGVTATGQTITLPTAVGILGRTYTIKLTAAGTGTVACNGAETIDGAATYTLSAQWKFITVQSTNAGWIIIGNN